MAQGTSGGFNVTIRALDEVTSVAERIKRELKTLGEAAQPPVKATNSLFDKLGVGIKETGRGLTEIGSKAREAGERLHRAFEPLADISGVGGIAAIGSIGGITLALDKYASSGANLFRTSQAMGINVQTLQTFQQGARLAGSDAGALTSGLDTLNQKLRGAAWGSDAGAIMAFKQLNIAIKGSNGEIRKAQDVLPEIAEAVKRNLADPYTAAVIAQKTLGDSAAVLMPYLRDGAEGIARFNREAKGFGAIMGPEAVRQAEEFEKSQREVGLALDGVGHAIGEAVLPTLTPMLKDFATWVATSPDVQKGVKGIADEVKEFGKWVKEMDWQKAQTGIAGIGTAFANVGTALGTVLDSMKWMEAHPTITGMVLGGVAGARVGGLPGAVIGTIGGGILGGAFEDDTKRQARSAAQLKWQADNNAGTDKRSFEQFKTDFETEWTRTHPRPGRQPDGSFYAPIPPAPGSPPGGAGAEGNRIDDTGTGSDLRHWLGGAKNTPWVKVERDMQDGEELDIWRSMRDAMRDMALAGSGGGGKAGVGGGPGSGPGDGGVPGSRRGGGVGGGGPPVGANADFKVPAGDDKDVIRRTVAGAGGNEKAQAAFLAMFNAEDPGLNPNTVRPGGTDASYAQWVGSRRRQLEGFGWRQGGDTATNRAASAKMLNWELTTSPTYKAMLKRMNEAPNETEAAKIGGFTFEQGGGDASLFGGGGHSQANMDWFHSNQAPKFLEYIKKQANEAAAPPPAAPAAAVPSPTASVIPYVAPTSRMPGIGDVIGAHGEKLTNDWIFGNRAHSGAGRPGFDDSGIEKQADIARSRREIAEMNKRIASGPLDAPEAPPVNLPAANQSSAAGDSKHQVEVSFANAPPGMRTGVKAQGDADFTLRTQHSLSSW